MNKKLVIFLGLIAFVLSFTIYESLKLEKKLVKSNYNVTGTVISKIPNELGWNTFPGQAKFDLVQLMSEGNKIIVHFWATWCGPCEVEFPELMELSSVLKSRKDIKFLLVAVNDDLKKIEKFLSKFEILESTIILTDELNDFKKFGTFKLPETFVFESDGTVIKKFTGQQKWTSTEILNFFKNL